ncbi:MAG: tRNA (adenosine(37)-N6)-threonylcarbamoyltransferase complex ATPase subunit type 1 TsaE [Chloroflexota bacterium]
MAILKADELDIISHSVEQTRRLGARLGALLLPGDVICLSGEMGAGKTVFTAGIGQGWGARYSVTSPTFNLVHEHTRDKDQHKLYHLDCYRLRGAQDAESIGLTDILDSDGIIVFEWPERIQKILPKKRLWIELRVVEQTRRNFVFEGQGKRYTDLIARFREMAYGV